MKPTEPIEMAKKTTKKPKEQMTRYQVASNWGKIECALSHEKAYGKIYEKIDEKIDEKAVESR